MIQIDQQQRHRTIFLTWRCLRPLQLLQQLPAVWQPRQRIVKSQAPDGFFRSFGSGYIPRQGKDAGNAFNLDDGRGKLSPHNFPVLFSELHFEGAAARVLSNGFGQDQAVAVIHPDSNFACGSPNNFFAFKSQSVDEGLIDVKKRRVAQTDDADGIKTVLKDGTVALLAQL
ncbi:MAG: hypothetical protein WAK26_00685 [Terracidiphilus sp.]